MKYKVAMGVVSGLVASVLGGGAVGFGQGTVQPPRPPPPPTHVLPIACAGASFTSLEIADSGTYLVTLVDWPGYTTQWGDRGDWNGVTLVASDGGGSSPWSGLVGQHVGATTTLRLRRGMRLTMSHMLRPPASADAHARADLVCHGGSSPVDQALFDAAGGLRATFRFVRVGD